MRKTVKIASLIIAAALLICGIVGINTSAEDAKLEIDSANVAYNDMMHLAFTVTGEAALPEGAVAGIIIWDGEKDDFTVANASYTTFDVASDGESTYYKSYGIAAPEIGKLIYVAACYKQGDAITVTEPPFKYSVVDYLIKRLDEKPTAIQAELYQNVLLYGAASDTVLAEGSYVLVKATNGYVGAMNRICEASKTLGTSFVLRAETVNEDGCYFIKWVDASGATVSTERVTTITPTSLGLSAYTAVYGDASESEYGKAYTFTDFETGEINVGTPDLTKAPGVECYGGYSGTNMKRWQVLYKGIDGITIDSYQLPAATVTGTTDKGKNVYEFTKDENGNYIVGAKDTYSIKETYYGDKYFSIERGQFGSGYSATFMNSVADCTVAEIDFNLDKLSAGGVQFHFNVWVTDGSKSGSYRLNLDASTSTGIGAFYAESSIASNGSDKYAIKLDGVKSTCDISGKKTVTLKIVLNTAGEKPCFDYYFDGVYAGSLTCETFNASGGHNSGIDFSKARIGSLSINTVTAAKDNINADNISFK